MPKISQTLKKKLGALRQLQPALARPWLRQSLKRTPRVRMSQLVSKESRNLQYTSNANMYMYWQVWNGHWSALETRPSLARSHHVQICLKIQRVDVSVYGQESVVKYLVLHVVGSREKRTRALFLGRTQSPTRARHIRKKEEQL